MGLNKSDNQQWEELNHRNIYVRSLAAGQRVMESVTRFLEGKLKLRVNRERAP
jgi:hypothetical protein